MATKNVERLTFRLSNDDKAQREDSAFLNDQPKDGERANLIKLMIFLAVKHKMVNSDKGGANG